MKQQRLLRRVLTAVHEMNIVETAGDVLDVTECFRHGCKEGLGGVANLLILPLQTWKTQVSTSFAKSRCALGERRGMQVSAVDLEVNLKVHSLTGPASRKQA
jgi:hypothetical protein